MKKRKRRSGIFWVCLIFVALAAYLVYDSMTNLDVTEYNISSEALPENLRGFKIVELSDLHGAEFGENNSELVARVRAQSPNIITLNGDLVTDAADLEPIKTLLPQLTEICPVYFVSGNHDFGSGEIRAIEEMLSDAGVKYLKNESVEIEYNGSRIILAGVEDPNSWADMISPDEFALRLREEYPDDYIVLLGHRNYWVENYPSLPVNLILCGHTHGGIVRIPFAGGLMSTDRTFFPEYDAGLFHSGSYDMIISRGLGDSSSVPRVLNRPEIVVVNLGYH